MSKLIVPQWPIPQGVAACSSTRVDEVSMPPYDSLNLGAHCDDNPEHVGESRKRLFAADNLPSKPVWLKQVHGKDVLKLTGEPHACKRTDISYSNMPDTVRAVVTADCLPVLFCNRAGTEIAAAHAGWRGSRASVLGKAVACFADKPENIIAWLGLAIGPNAFEVGPEVHEAFMTKDPQADLTFVPRGDKYLADVYQLARQRLSSVGVENIHNGDRCTFSESETSLSYRRGNITGRMASFVWLIQPKESRRSGTCNFLFT